jgi:Uma2 family endonuclease
MTSPTLADLNPPGEPNVVFHDASWAFYEALLAEFGEQPKRVNYDRGTLEIMTISFEHEGYKEAIGDMISDISKEFDIPMARRGSSTLKREEKQRGLESDQCYWIANERIVRGLKRLDLGIHPPPDLVLEIDITHAAVDRESIYSALGVPEMWHFDGQTLLSAWELVEGNWNRIERSKSFPMIRIADLNPFIKRLPTDGDTKVLRDFRDWLRTLPR